MSNIVLIGFQGVGKTFYGKRVAALLNVEFIDTDSVMNEEFGGGFSNREIFLEIGEEKFRMKEKKIIEGLVNKVEKSVIATGGGVVEIPGIGSILKSLGKVLYLQKELSCLRKRWEGGERIYLKGKSVEEVYLRRDILYREVCTETVEGDWDQILLADSLR